MTRNELAEIAAATEFDQELLALLNAAPQPPPQWPLRVWPCPPLQSLTIEELRQVASYWRAMRRHEDRLKQQAGFVELDQALSIISQEALAARRFLRYWHPSYRRGQRNASNR